MSDTRDLAYYRANPTYCKAKLVNGCAMWSGRARILSQWQEPRRFGRTTREYTRLRVQAPDGKFYSPLLSMVELVTERETVPAEVNPAAVETPVPAPVAEAVAPIDLTAVLDALNPSQIVQLQELAKRAGESAQGEKERREVIYYVPSTLKDGTVKHYFYKRWERYENGKRKTEYIGPAGIPPVVVGKAA